MKTNILRRTEIDLSKTKTIMLFAPNLFKTMNCKPYIVDRSKVKAVSLSEVEKFFCLIFTFFPIRFQRLDVLSSVFLQEHFLILLFFFGIHLGGF